MTPALFFLRNTAEERDDHSVNMASFSSARTTKRFPSPRCASTIQIVRPSQSKAATQPKLHPALLRLSASSVVSQKRKKKVSTFFCNPG
jgi:hypothetical protein